DLMIHVDINRTMVNEDVRLLSPQKFGHRVDMRPRKLCGSIDLSEKDRLRAHKFASYLAFSGADLGGIIEAFVANAPFAACEINHANGMACLSVPNQSAAGSGFGVIGVPSDANDFEFAVGREFRRGRSQGQFS